MRTRNIIQAAALTCSLCFGLSAQSDRVPRGTEITVRTNDSIEAKPPNEGKIYSAVVDRDVQNRSGQVIIPRGSDAELIVRDTADKNLVLDLESVNVNGKRYIVSTADEQINASENQKEGVGANKRTGKYVGGGAILGSIIGAIAGGGKGAAIGAATGAGAGAVGQTVTRGGEVRVPAESLITFRLDRALTVGGPDDGFDRNGQHYHQYNDRQYNDRRNYRSRQNDNSNRQN
jgi:hypothetical protein